jgi:23S rRNA (cytidine1920-2'-O)/16S rRNA (cytidine1409-2'-O)-methyltransferase
VDAQVRERSMKSNPKRRELPSKADSAKTEKIRIDVLLVERGLAASRERAQGILLAGSVRVNGVTVDKPGTRVGRDAAVELADTGPKFASRGGLKLEGALEDFAVDVAGKICLDVGSSTGGFTDCLLQHGAAKVYAVDVNVKQLDWGLANEARVAKVAKNARYLKRGDIAEEPGLIVVDVSFISVTKILPAVAALAAPRADFLILVKPQFELEKRDVGKGGIVRDPELHQKAIESVTAAAAREGLEISGVKASRLRGTEGNQEFFLHARRKG